MSAFLIGALKGTIMFLMASTAIGLAFVAVRPGLRATPQAGPAFHPWGATPPFTPEQIRRITPDEWSRDPLRRFVELPHSDSVGLASHTDTGGTGPSPSGPDAARFNPSDIIENSWRRPRG